MLAQAAVDLSQQMVQLLVQQEHRPCQQRRFVGCPPIRTRDRLPSTVLVNILGCLKRRDLDVLELVDRAFGALVDTHEKHLPRRALSLTFFNEGDASLISFKDTMVHVRVVEMQRYLAHSTITKMFFRPTHTFTECTLQGLNACCAYLADEGAFIYEGRRGHYSEDALPHNTAALPWLANCASLQIDEYREEFFDADGALAWLLATHSTAVHREKHLSLKRCLADVMNFCRPLVVAIEKQFADATSPSTFKLELSFLIPEEDAGPFGETRTVVNDSTHEKLLVEVQHVHHAWVQQVVRIVEVTITIQRQPLR
ncbi:hypothetical protein AAVH_28402 [Aphelenchoides avenae]|nr:hypothetical protein AAVH_28402 [Aphelenchus avenae]